MATSSSESQNSNNDNVLSQSIGIIGAGVSALIHAHVLLQDGFSDITLITKDTAVGGTWARQRVYPGLHLNNIYGEYRFSAMDMLPPENCAESGGRLSGLDISNYVQSYVDKFLVGRVRFVFEREVIGVRRVKVGQWQVQVRHHPSSGEGEQIEETLDFNRIILATGGCSRPLIPHSLSKESAQKAGFRGLVLHTSEFASQLQDILSITQPVKEGQSGDDNNVILVVGTGKSAQDACAKLTIEGRKTIMVFETPRTFSASPRPLPEFLRKSRFISVLAGHHTLNTRLERFFHTTTLGSRLVRGIWDSIASGSHAAAMVEKNSPLYPKESFFWSLPTGNAGVIGPDSFFQLVASDKIQIISPARASGYTSDGQSVTLSNGEVITPKVVILATGYQCSWSGVISESLSNELGMDRQAWTTDWSNKWNYSSLHDRRDFKDNNNGFFPIHRGIVPIKNLENRDFAIAGALFSANISYTNEVAAHWVASYFRGDPMQLPSSFDEAVLIAEERGAWSNIRCPSASTLLYGSQSATALHFWTWPQYADELLEDMYLPSVRSSRGRFGWLFSVIDFKELSTLSEERRLKRGTSKA